MRLAKAPALINTTWQRLIRVAWVPSNQSIVKKSPHCIPVPSQWSLALPDPDCSPSIWRECFIFGLKILKIEWLIVQSSNTLSALIVGEQAGVTAACAAGFPGGKKLEENIKGVVIAALLVRMKMEFRNFYLASESLMGRLVNVGASERWTMCIRRWYGPVDI